MKQNFFILAAALLAVHSAVIAVTILQTGIVSPYSHHGIAAFAPHLLSFAALTVLVLTIRQTLWRIGGILAALSALMRSAMTSFPERTTDFGITTIIVSAASLLALLASWRLETLDLSWWERGAARQATNRIFAILIAFAVVGIFLYWGRR